MNEKNWLVKTGDFFFKWRNIVFPLILAGLFLSFPPPAQYWGLHWLENGKDLFAGLLVLSGLAFRIATIGWAYIKRGGLNKQVYADKLVTAGFFNLCRNPLYVGNMLIYSGIFILHGHPVVVVAGIALYWFIYESIIAAEEHFLKNKFGAEYKEYCARVPRWIPDFSRYAAATEGMSFSYLRAIAKDYTTIFNAVVAMVFIELVEHYLYFPKPVFMAALQLGLAVLTVLFAGVVAIKILKKSGRLKEVS